MAVARIPAGEGTLPVAAARAPVAEVAGTVAARAQGEELQALPAVAAVPITDEPIISPLHFSTLTYLYF